MALYYVETGIGCCIRRARSEDQALEDALREVGTWNGIKAVRLASEADLAWVRGMGGRVPKDYEESAHA